jgi:hypothetical protein
LKLCASVETLFIQGLYWSGSPYTDETSLHSLCTF